MWDPYPKAADHLPGSRSQEAPFSVGGERFPRQEYPTRVQSPQDP